MSSDSRADPKPSTHDPGGVLLCERCGYTIDHLPDDGPCPECGKPIAESLPERRTGSPFQRRPTFANWWRTNWQVLRHPRRTFDVLVIECRASGRLMWWNLAAATLCAWMGSFGALLITIIDDFHHGRVASSPVGPPARRMALALALGTVIFWLIAIPLLRLLTVIEQLGITFFGRRRGWRITAPVAYAICGHAAGGWIAGGAVFGSAWLLALAINSALPKGLPKGPALSLIPLAAFAGLLTFETLVYIGMRRCRFANPPRPTPVAHHPAATAASAAPDQPA